MHKNIAWIALIVLTGININPEVISSISNPEQLQSKQQILSEIIAQNNKILPGSDRSDRRNNEKNSKS